MLNIKTLLAAVLATAAIAPAFAQVAATPRIDQRQENQQARIAATERRATADGVVTPRKQRKTEHMQDNASNNINKNKKKHNKKRAPKKKPHNHHEHAYYKQPQYR